MDKNGNITIDNFQNGIADSAHLGFSKIVNIDVISSPGVAKINYSTNAFVSSTGGVTGGSLTRKIGIAKSATSLFITNNF